MLQDGRTIATSCAIFSRAVIGQSFTGRDYINRCAAVVELILDLVLERVAQNQLSALSWLLPTHGKPGDSTRTPTTAANVGKASRPRGLRLRRRGNCNVRRQSRGRRTAQNAGRTTTDRRETQGVDRSLQTALLLGCRRRQLLLSALRLERLLLPLFGCQGCRNRRGRGRSALRSTGRASTQRDDRLSRRRRRRAARRPLGRRREGRRR